MKSVYFAGWITLSFIVGIFDSTFHQARFEESSFYNQSTQTQNVYVCEAIQEGNSASSFCQLREGWNKIWGSSNIILGGVNFLTFFATDFLPVIGHVALWNYSMFDYGFLGYAQGLLVIATIIAFIFVVRDFILSRN